MTAWAGEHAEALAQIDAIVKQDPDDVEMKVLQAEVNVWEKNLDKALELYLPLVKQYPDNIAVATGFANTAAKTRGPLTAEATTILLRIADRAASPDNKDPLLVAHRRGLCREAE